MLRFIACDDNEEVLEKMVLSIRKIMMPYDYDYKINKFTKYNEELKKIINTKGDQKVYLLDIEMPEISGLEIASEIRENGDWESMIIFISVHPELKDNIFFKRLMALDFISKYYSYEKRLEESLNKVLEIYNINTVLTFTFDYITYRVPATKILYIEKVTGDKKCIIVSEDEEEYEVISSLKQIMKKLPPYFYQTHKACIVNTKKISQVDYVDNLITFNNKITTNLLSQRSKKGLKEHVGIY